MRRSGRDLPRGFGARNGLGLGPEMGYIGVKRVMSRVYICEVIPDGVGDPAHQRARIFGKHSPTLVGDALQLIVGSKGVSYGGALVFRRSEGDVWSATIIGRVPVLTRDFVAVGFNSDWVLSVTFSDLIRKDLLHDPFTEPFYGAWPDLDEVFIWTERTAVHQRGHSSRFRVGGRAEYEESLRKTEG